MASDLFIRKAGKADEEAIYRMICGLEEVVLDREAFNRVFSQNVTATNISYFIAEINHTPVAMVSCHIQPLLHHAALVSEIQEMYVDPAFRSQSVGNALMDHVVSFAKSEGSIQIEVTSRNTRADAHRFYQREGFSKSHVKLVRYFDRKE